MNLEPIGSKQPPRPVDVECLKRIVSGGYRNRRKLIDAYLRMTAEQLKNLDHAVSLQSAKDVETLAHSCIGSSNLLGMTAIVPPLCQLEEMGIRRQLTGAGEVLAQAWIELGRMESFLAWSKDRGEYAETARRR